MFVGYIQAVSMQLFLSRLVKLLSQLCKAAKKYGTIVSYDLNYRPSMWDAIGGLELRLRKLTRRVAKYVDVMIGNEEDFTACLGFEIEGNDAEPQGRSTLTATRR